MSVFRRGGDYYLTWAIQYFATQGKYERCERHPRMSDVNRTGPITP